MEARGKKFVRRAAGQTWEDNTLAEWDPTDYRKVFEFFDFRLYFSRKVINSYSIKSYSIDSAISSLIFIILAFDDFSFFFFTVVGPNKEH